jgi:flagellar export protein FliJ
MTRDPLEALLRLRRLAADEARRSLADSLRAEDQAVQAIAVIEAAIERETEAATNLAAGDAEVEAFSAWLRRIRPKQHAAYAAGDHAEAETARARIVLAAARAAVQAAEEMLEKQAAARQAEAERKEQHALDEVAQRSGTVKERNATALNRNASYHMLIYDCTIIFSDGSLCLPPASRASLSRGPRTPISRCALFWAPTA